MNNILKRLGLKDDYGFCDPSIVGFVILWSAFCYGAYITAVAIVERLYG